MLLLVSLVSGDPVDAPPAQLALWQIVVGVAGAITTITIIAGAFWWLFGPRIRDYIEGIATKVTETHRSVTVNHHSSPEPTMRDDLSDVKSQVRDVQGQLAQLTALGAATSQRASDLGDLVSGLSDRVSDVHDIARDTKAALEDHEKRGERYLGKVELVMREKGIELPPADD